MASAQADDPRLTNHLKSPDFFDIAAHPRATFTSTAVRASGPAGATHTLTGELSLRGVTRAISFPATVAVSPTELTARAEFTINRRDFGITYPGCPTTSSATTSPSASSSAPPARRPAEPQPRASRARRSSGCSLYQVS